MTPSLNWELWLSSGYSFYRFSLHFVGYFKLKTSLLGPGSLMLPGHLGLCNSYLYFPILRCYTHLLSPLWCMCPYCMLEHLWGICPEVGWLGLQVGLCPIFWGTTRLISRVVVPAYNPSLHLLSLLPHQILPFSHFVLFLTEGRMVHLLFFFFPKMTFFF